jgi:hypothetical protein
MAANGSNHRDALGALFGACSTARACSSVAIRPTDKATARCGGSNAITSDAGPPLSW